MDDQIEVKPRVIIEQIVKNSVAGIARSAGFKKSRLNFFRRKGSVIQVINIQLSCYNRGSEGQFYVNVAFAFDEFRHYISKPIDETPLEYECDFRERLEYLIPDTPHIWKITSQVDKDAMAQALSQRINTILIFLNQIDSLSSFLEIALQNKWFALPGEYETLASFHEAIGKYKVATEYKKLFEEFLYNRATMTQAEFDKYYGHLYHSKGVKLCFGD
jgi:hypothetical protein